MKFPYGISNFNKIVSEGYFYVDRTSRFPLLEEAGAQLLLLRPRRFGKSLLISMLESYYDLAKAEEFPRIFGKLDISSHPTPLRNHYCVMKWDFSQVDAQGNIQQIKQAVYDHINASIEDCMHRYQTLFQHAVKLSDNAMYSLQSLVSAINLAGHKLYLLIDEYDSFANEVMASQVNQNQRYAELVYGEGLLKGVFKNVKALTAGRGLDRVFITGVSPVVMADISSGYNVVKNIYRQPDFNDLCGFHEAEIQQALQQIAVDCQLSSAQQTEALELMRRFYNGYCFNLRNSQKVYNPTLALYFLEALARECRYPETLLDHNLAMDRNRLNYIAKLPQGAKVIERALDESKPLTVTKLHDRFGVEDMLQRQQGQQELASLLYYLGVLTLDGIVGLGEIQLRIPNLVIRSLYVEKLRQLLIPQVDEESSFAAAKTFFLTGDLQPICDLIETRFAVFSNRDYQWKAEMAVKTAFLMLLFDDRLYMIDSETELQRRYADLTLIARPDARQYQILDHLLEFKFLSLEKDLKLTAAQLRDLPATELQTLPAVQAAFAEALPQLQAYSAVLRQHYSTVLQLHITAVVALGFERLVWQAFDI